MPVTLPADVETILMSAAREASTRAWAPYSGFRVGAALLTDGGIVTGCNVENASYSLTICAERNAVFQAVARGFRGFSGLAVYVDSDRIFPPCGACRQVLAEFAPELPVIFFNQQDTVRTDMAELLPHRFSLESGID